MPIAIKLTSTSVCSTDQGELLIHCEGVELRKGLDLGQAYF